ALGGAVRETGSSAVTSLGNVPVKMQGGVLEFGADPRPLTLGTGVGQIDMSGAGGGGFSAFGGSRNVSLNGGAPLQWGSTGQYVASGQPLLFGSLTADSAVNFLNPINLQGGGTLARTVDVIDDPAVSTD